MSEGELRRAGENEEEELEKHMMWLLSVQGGGDYYV